MIRTAAVRVHSAVSVGCGGRGLSTGQTRLSSKVRRMLIEGERRTRKQSLTNSDFSLLDQPAAQDTFNPTKTRFKVPKSNRHRNLNKVFLNKITDILSTGELSSQLYGRGVELSQVCLHPDMEGISVYWTASGNPEQDLETQKILQTNAKKVRHELTSLNILSHSPTLMFLRDDRLHKLKEVERLLKIADYGEDFEPANPAHRLLSAPPTLTMPLNPNVKAALESLQKINDEGEQPDPFEVALKIASEPPQDTEEPTLALPKDLPTMKMDVFSVNTEKIYSIVQQGIKKARAEHRRLSESDSVGRLNEYNTQHLSDPVTVNRKRDIQHWANTYKKLQRHKACVENLEKESLQNPDDYLDQDFEEEEIEVQWEEELEYDEES